jgi:hypothetical protein
VSRNGVNAQCTMSVVNVDTRLMKNGNASLSRVDEQLVEMQNG